MRLYALKSSHLTGSACTIILILMVLVIDSAGSNSIRLFHDKSRGYLTVSKDGTVRTSAANKENYQNLVMTGDKDFVITLFNEATRRYLCFNKAGKLVAKKRPKICSMCRFKEQMINGFHRFESVHHFGKFKTRKLIAFTHKGDPSKNNTFPLFVKKELSHRGNDTTHKGRHSRARHARRHC